MYHVCRKCKKRRQIHSFKCRGQKKRVFCKYCIEDRLEKFSEQRRAKRRGHRRAHDEAVANGRYGFVYFIVFYSEIGKGYCKIGYSADPASRFSELQVGNPFPLQLAHFFGGDRDAEAEMHERFASQRVRGEWFRLAGPIDRYLDKVCGRHG